VPKLGIGEACFIHTLRRPNAHHRDCCGSVGFRSSSPGGGSARSRRLPDIQAALNAVSGDEVLVAAGTYAENLTMSTDGTCCTVNPAPLRPSWTEEESNQL